MKRFIDYGKIHQFRQIIKDVAYLAYEDALPELSFTGTEKIHGTNAGVCYSEADGFWVQSRKNIITPEKDNNACAFHVEANKTSWMNLIMQLAEAHNINLTTHIISLYFEWAGGNIQKVSALTGLPKQAILFNHFKVSEIEPVLNKDKEDITPYTWMSTNNIEDIEADIRNISNFPTQTISINFNEPLLKQSFLISLIDSLEENSLVGAALGIKGNVGEGYVFTAYYKNQFLRFKVKGEKHAASSGKVKTLSPVDQASEQKKVDFVNNVGCISWRLEQMLTEIQKEHSEITIKQTGDFIRKVIKDIIEEESDIMQELGIEPKSINSMVSRVAKNYFMERL